MLKCCHCHVHGMHFFFFFLTGLMIGCEISKGVDDRVDVELSVLVIFFSSVKEEVVLQLWGENEDVKSMSLRL